MNPNTNICNYCGEGDFERRGGKWVCTSCGSHKPEIITGEETTLLYTAYQKLRLADFAEAESEFDDILRKYPESPTAYWGRLMARYGIKYERDFDGSMIPTCYAASIESLTAAQDYQMALKYADGDSKAFYQSQVHYIERVRKEWIEKAKKEKPYDIFLCYKESDLPNGIERTKDSLAMQELYVHLTGKGYRVFYSHESLREKVGEKYEPYIFNALSTAKVMIVYGSKPEYITSVWMKNEWMRYEKRMKAGEKKQDSLLVACEGFQPRELPTVLASKQCLNAKDKSFYSDLDEAIEKIIYGATLSEIRRTERKERAPIFITAFLLMAVLIGSLAWYFLRPVSELTDSGYGATVSANYGSFSWNTFLRVEALREDEWQNRIETLHVDPEGIRLYRLSLREGQNEMSWEGDLTVRIPLPDGVSAARAAIYELNGDKTRKINFEISEGTLVFKTNMLSVYLIAKREHTVTVDAAIEPTCTSEGYTEGTHCADCDEILTERQIIPALGHSAGAAATCTTAQICTVCDSELKPAVGHRHTSSVTEPTCTAEGYTTYTCHCGDSYTDQIVSALGHQAGASATCTEPQICTRCSAELNPATGHSHREIVIPPTCTKDGYTEHVCRCGDRYTDNPVSASGHQAGASATCTEDQFCTVCNTVLMKALGHQAGAAATCTDSQICTRCSAELNPATGHTHQKTVIPPTCTEDGYTEYVCRCGDRYTNSPVSALGHRNGEWEIETLATTEREGLFVQKCTACKKILTEAVIPKEKTPSQGLDFISNGDGTCRVSGLGICTDTDIVIPYEYNGERVTGIGERAFWSCDELITITIPATVTDVGEAAFAFCSSLTDIYVNDGNRYFTSENGVLFDKDRKKLICYPIKKTESSYSIPAGVTEIVGYAFAYCSHLTNVTIPDSVTAIGQSAFFDCSSLTKISIPAAVSAIGDSAFAACDQLTEISVSEINPSFTSENGILFNKTMTKLICYPEGKTESSYTVPDGVTDIGTHAFYDCSSLITVTLPSGVMNIGRWTFAHCNNLQSITLPSNISTMGFYAFAWCPKLTSIYFGGTTAQWTDGKVMFNMDWDIYTEAYTVVCSDGTVSKEGAITTPTEGLAFTSNGNGTCYVSGIGTCSEEADIVIPSEYQGERVTGIGAYAFGHCINLNSITIPEGVTEIAEGAFIYSGLKTVIMPQSVTSLGGAVFRGCTNLTDVMIPMELTSIPDNAFRDTGLTHATIPSGVTGIGSHAFSGCEALTDITIPSGVTMIGEGAFGNCSNLRSVTIPEGVMEMGELAFGSCTGLESVTIPSSITQMRRYLLYYCEKLTRIHFTGTIEQWQSLSKENDWDYHTGNYTVHCKDGILLDAKEKN
ncbi:MAG: leucine-rich repeat protein [Clostridia bacterium]|nr:leucine-rich repeat protein [Clostridia bacterium]